MDSSSTTKSQRIFIWVIAIVMSVGTLGSFFIFMLPSSNTPVTSQAQLDYEKQLADAQKQETARLASLKPLDGYSAEAFDAASVTELKVDEITAGTGKDVTETSTISANYFGWTSDGKIFDSTNKSGTTTPIEFPLSGVIQGWTKGLAGAKEGAIRKLTIPTAQAYGDSAASNGSPAGPLMFVVEIKSVK